MEIRTNEELLKAKDEALDPEQSRDYVEFGDGETIKRCKVRLLPLKVERRIKAAISEQLPLLNKLDQPGLEVMGEIFDAATEILPEIVAAGFEKDGISVEWLEENASHKQLVDATMALIRKMGLADALGKLLRRGVPKG